MILSCRQGSAHQSRLPPQKKAVQAGSGNHPGAEGSQGVPTVRHVPTAQHSFLGSSAVPPRDIYSNGLHHGESKTVQGMSVVTLCFHPGTNMARAMAEPVGYVNRARGYQPQGTLPPFIVRFDVSNVPIGYLVAETDGKRPLGE